MNETSKFVVSHKLFEPGWNNVSVIHGDVIGQIKALKDVRFSPGLPLSWLVFRI
jgi:hypothetical protein